MKTYKEVFRIQWTGPEIREGHTYDDIPDTLDIPFETYGEAVEYATQNQLTDRFHIQKAFEAEDVV